MCTRVVWHHADGVVVGRNMDFHEDLQTNLWTQPKGISRDDGVEGKLTWTSTYGSVVATAFDMISVDGLNDVGLAGHVLWLAESDYGTPDSTRTQLSQATWLQYYLDNFATVAEAVEWTESTDVQVVQMIDPTGGKPPAIHLALDDSTGDSAIIEYADGKPKVYHSADYTVMTNSPTYDHQLELVKTVTGLGGAAPLPGSTLASDRFARASYYVSRLEQPRSELQAIAGMFSVIRNAAQPFREPDPGKPDASQTLWQVVADLTNKQYVFESTTRPNTVWVDLAKVDLSAGAPECKLDLVDELAVQHGIAGEVSDKFVDAGKLNFLTLEMEKQMLAAAHAPGSAG
ncbi:linear amide C-N hydrolase [Microbacterium aquimaris]|uniref:linear amide C-N hydrolase n=1 Tax=Microbacterium aquimaris TaxID=459816 RepID=UPI002AD353FC|nr:linear amide C-N hydrolase [Microbacterium aquimaris]MDZ8274798.1 linear amide C-N hydrolase [Microbacterium aquimaris]